MTAKEQAYELLRMYDEGMSHLEIALETNWSISLVAKELANLPEYKARRRGPRKQNLHQNIDNEGKEKSPILEVKFKPTNNHRRRGRF